MGMHQWQANSLLGAIPRWPRVKMFDPLSSPVALSMYFCSDPRMLSKAADTHQEAPERDVVLEHLAAMLTATDQSMTDADTVETPLAWTANAPLIPSLSPRSQQPTTPVIPVRKLRAG
jgi:hypothetical protein